MINTENTFPEISELLEQHPKAGAALTSWITGHLEKFQKKLALQLEGESFIPEIDEHIARVAVKSTIMGNQQLLFYFFDDHRVYVNIYSGLGHFVMHHLVGDTDTPDTGNTRFPSRGEAERAGFRKAFKLLEETL